MKFRTDKYALLLFLVGVAAGVVFLAAHPARADTCSAYSPNAVYEEYWGYNRALAGQMMCSVDNVSQSVCEAHGGDFKPDNGSGKVVCFLPPPPEGSDSPGSGDDNAAASPPPGGSRLSAAQCDSLMARWNYLMHDMKPPIEFRRFLANEINAIMGEVDEPAKACSDGNVYRDIRHQTLDVERQVIMQCGRSFTAGNGTTEDASNIDDRIAAEEKEIAESSARICSAAQKQLRAQQAASGPPTAGGPGAGSGGGPGSGGSPASDRSAAKTPQACIVPHFKLESSYYNGYFENTCPVPVTFDFQSCEITPDQQQACKKETKSVSANGKVEVSNYKKRPVAQNERAGKLR